MPDIQRELFAWATQQHATVTLAIFALGLLYAFMGFRFHTLLLALTCGFVGFVGGALAAPLAEIDGTVGGAGGAAIGLGITFASRRAGAVVATAATWGVLGFYLLYQCGMIPPTLSIAALVLAALGAGFACVCRQAARAVLTAQQGVALIVVGWVGVANALIPSVGRTFVEWSSSWSLLVPTILLMLFVTGYSYQAMNLRGDIRTGAA